MQRQLCPNHRNNMKLDGESIVKINVRGHNVTIKDEIEVCINHKKSCENPCIDTPQIVTYLEDEMFVAEGFFVMSSQDY
jgi:hypothetical protein